MKIGFGSYALRWHFFEGMTSTELIDTAKRSEAEVVQLCENVEIDRLTGGELAALRGTAEKEGISLEIGVSGGKREILSRGLRHAVSLGAKVLRAVIDSDGETPQQVMGTIRGLLPELRRTGVTLCIENHFRFPPAVVADIIRRLADGRVAACLDPLNSMSLMIGPEQTCRELVALAKTAHIKDARIERRGTGFFLQGCPLGEGMLDLPGYIRELPDQVSSLLIESWMDKRETRQETLKQELAWLKHGLYYVRRHL